MKLEKMLDRYPSLKPVVEQIVRMKLEGKSYRDIKSYWDTTVSQLYPNHKVACPSRSSLWRLEELRKEQVMLVSGWKKCPVCERLVRREELSPIIFEGEEVMLCSDCHSEYQIRRTAPNSIQSKPQNLADYIIVVRKRGWTTNYNPRSDEE
ncbi:hypothetical protein MUP77_08165 [Candidatus Bathyarchaeota archaeon]|nr:hypothetical protein [Candidatus Bathyarchaeota archaeon]